MTAKPGIEFGRFAGACAVLTGITGFLYSVSFVIISRSQPDAGKFLSGLFLLLGGVLATAVVTALYQRLRETDAEFALWGLILGAIAATGSALHGAFDLATVIHPPAAAAADIPSPADPRGILTFGIAGLSVFVFAWLIGRDARFPRGLGYLGFASAVLLVLLYLARLIILEPTSPAVAVPAVLEGFLVNPAWYVWVGLTLLRPG